MIDVELAMCQYGSGSESEWVPDKELLERYRNGDEHAATLLFNRYYRRLMTRAREAMGVALRQTGESADLVQSVFESVFLGNGKQIDIGRDDSLWPLLVTILLNKIRNRVRFHKRKRRDRRREKPLQDHDPLETGPTGEHVAELDDLRERLLEHFEQISYRRRRIVECLLDGDSVAEIVRNLGTSKRTVYRTREAAVQILEQWLKES